MSSWAAGWLDAHGDPTPVVDVRARVLSAAAQAGVPLPLASLALCSFMPTTLERLREATHAAALAARLGPLPPIAVGELAGAPVVVMPLTFGAPAASAEVEELLATGVRTLLIGGATGSLQPHVAIGAYVVPTGAIREEGTSYHYAPADQPARAGGPAMRALWEAAEASGRHAVQGRVWTTDAPYREFAGKVRRYQSDGVLGVEMESSALMVVAEARGVDLGVLLTVSDHVFDPAWPNIFGTDPFRANCVALADVLLAAARRLLNSPG
ncbi:MAG: nucleoside phosphorylase [Actinobacteria bacterium]|nr:nucleoside phosphorylase [Actinomycetota bacterium]